MILFFFLFNFFHFIKVLTPVPLRGRTLRKALPQLVFLSVILWWKLSILLLALPDVIFEDVNFLLVEILDPIIMSRSSWSQAWPQLVLFIDLLFIPLVHFVAFFLEEFVSIAGRVIFGLIQLVVLRSLLLILKVGRVQRSVPIVRTLPFFFLVLVHFLIVVPIPSRDQLHIGQVLHVILQNSSLLQKESSASGADVKVINLFPLFSIVLSIITLLLTTLFRIFLSF
mmetsp:Transcript_22911/g.22204  ORF Transcript_22911/g.22204 Transcript_22911/m.22204 type:complete len:226 (+) Transcript_22911:507-1184(+)